MNILLLFIIVSLYHFHCILKLRRSDKIQDIGHNTIPVLSTRLKPVPDLIGVSVLLWSALVCRQNLTPLFTTHIVMALLRIVTMHLTVLPPPRSFECTNIHRLECTQDYIFSGHTAMTVTSLLFIAAAYGQSSYIPLSLIGMLQMFVIIGLRMHYTIDVFFGTLLSLVMFFKFKK